MTRKFAFPAILALLIGFTMLALAAPVLAQPAAQVYYYTPTAEPSGNIYYIVKQNDTCTGIALLNNITEDQLRGLNNLRLNDCNTLQVGRKLLLAVVTPTTPTAGPSLTPTSSLPTPTPFSGNGQVCVFLFEDANGNSTPDGTESGINGGVVSLSDRGGQVSQTKDTLAGTDPVCFTDIPAGDYNISVAPPQGYNATTSMNYALKLVAGDSAILDFGAQPSAQAAPETGQPSTDSGISPLLAILGAIAILGGIALAVVARRLSR